MISCIVGVAVATNVLNQNTLLRITYLIIFKCRYYYNYVLCIILEKFSEKVVEKTIYMPQEENAFPPLNIAALRFASGLKNSAGGKALFSSLGM